MIEIRQVKMEDLSEITKIEQQCFTKEEAATKDVFKRRIQGFPGQFFVAVSDGEIAGFINGPITNSPYITDDLFSEVSDPPIDQGHQSILGLAVVPSFQKQGVAASLLQHFENSAKKKHCKTLTLTCKETLIPFYEKFGYIKKGISDSQHGGVTWYNMVKPLN